jgi:Spy/CpxP family protein refolding chaperone
MKQRVSRKILLVVATAGLVFTAAYAQAPVQGPPPQGQGAPGGFPQGGRGGRGGLPGATPEQNQAVMEMNTALAPLIAAATTARNDLANIAIADVKNAAGLRAGAEKLAAAELAVATARADAFAKLQSGPNKLSAEQVTALINMGAGAGGRGGGRGGGF